MKKRLIYFYDCPWFNPLMRGLACCLLALLLGLVAYGYLIQH
jgi:hypothetical protein